MKCPATALNHMSSPAPIAGCSGRPSLPGKDITHRLGLIGASLQTMPLVVQHCSSFLLTYM